jgi:hypothetical protein
MYSVINSNEDILFTILCKLSSYKRSKVCTVCKLWNVTTGRVISLIEKGPSWDDAFRMKHYHRIIRYLLDATKPPIVLNMQPIWDGDHKYMIKLYDSIEEKLDNIHSIAHVLAERGYKKSVMWILDKFSMYDSGECQSTEFDIFAWVQNTIFIGFCVGKHFDMLDLCGEVDSDVVYDGIMSASNARYRPETAEMIIKSYKHIDDKALYSIAVENDDLQLMVALMAF